MECNETLEYVAQRSYGCHILEGVQDKTGWDPEQSDLVRGNPAQARGWNCMIIKVLPTQDIL